MKVKELIKILETLDQEEEILVYDTDTGYDEPILDVYTNDDGTYYI